MTILNHLLAIRIARHADRIGKLTELNAPEMVVEQERKLLKRAQAGDFGKVGANKGESADALLAREVIDAKWSTGNGGKPYLIITTPQGTVNYFPAAKYGPFIATSEARNS